MYHGHFFDQKMYLKDSKTKAVIEEVYDDGTYVLEDGKLSGADYKLVGRQTEDDKIVKSNQLLLVDYES